MSPRSHTPDRYSFHGIASRGLLAHLSPADAVGWERWSALLDAALAGGASDTGAIPPRVVAAAQRCGVLTFAQSEATAWRFAVGRLVDIENPELSYVREGHTSSVWRVAGHRLNQGVQLAINVARDDAGGAELERSAAILDELAATGDAPVATVVARARDELPSGARPAVVAQEWIEGSFELAFLPSRRGGRRLYAVEQWLTAPDAPARIRGITGYALDDAEHVDVAHRVADVMLRAVRGVSGDRVCFPRIDVTHGDWMWAPGSLHIIATAGEHDVVPRADARAYLGDTLVRGTDDAGGHVRALLQRGAGQAWEGACAAGLPGVGLIESA